MDDLATDLSFEDIHERVVQLLAKAEQLQDDGTRFSRDLIAWTRAMSRFIRMAWTERKVALPTNFIVGDVIFPPFSEMMNPSNRESVPSCFRRFVINHCNFLSTRGAKALVEDFDYYLLFYVLFTELGQLIKSDSFYNAQSSFKMFVHRFKYYFMTGCRLDKLLPRFREMMSMRIHADEFKKLCKPLSHDLYTLESDPTAKIPSRHGGRDATAILDEREIQRGFFFKNIPPIDAKFPRLVSIPRAAKYCGVQYNTIKRWDSCLTIFGGTLPENARDYPGRIDEQKLRDFAKSYRERVGFPPYQE